MLNAQEKTELWVEGELMSDKRVSGSGSEQVTALFDGFSGAWREYNLII